MSQKNEHEHIRESEVGITVQQKKTGNTFQKRVGLVSDSLCCGRPTIGELCSINLATCLLITGRD